VTLTGRVSLFFLSMLAVVLVGFSTVLYLLARSHLHRQSEERLDAALNTLVAAAEVGPNGIEWEPGERSVILGPAALGDRLVWLVSDERGRVVDQSEKAGSQDFLAAAARSVGSEQRPARRLDWQGERWLFGQHRVQSGDSALTSNKAERRGPGDGPGKRVAGLEIAVAVSLEPVRDTLRGLAGALIGLSAGVWLLALVGGRWVCRHALLPVTHMAAAARDMEVGNLNGRLPAAATGDQLADLSQSFNSLLDRLQESFERQKRFTADVSHQLRTPLTTIIGQVDVALRRERPFEEYRRVLTTVLQQSQRLRQIAESLLFLARADSEAGRPESERVDLHEWLPGHLRTWAEHARAGDIHLTSGGDGLAVVEVQPVLLGELLNVLIDNACKFSQPGSPIRIVPRREAGSVWLGVEDRGTGIDAADLPRLFTPFFRAADGRRKSVEGTGLGLSLAKRLSALFGGELSVTSEPGQGSRFVVRLPLAKSREQLTATDTNASEPSATTAADTREVSQ
jgi:heavy metal sensor kinase